MTEKTIFNLFVRLMKHLNLDFEVTLDDIMPEHSTLRYSVKFKPKDKDIVVLLKNNMSKFKTIPTVTKLIDNTEEQTEEQFISEFLRYLINGRFEFIFQRNDLPDDLLSPMRKSSFKLPESLEELEILLTVKGY